MVRYRLICTTPGCPSDNRDAVTINLPKALPEDDGMLRGYVCGYCGLPYFSRGRPADTERGRRVKENIRYEPKPKPKVPEPPELVGERKTVINKDGVTVYADTGEPVA